MSEVEGASNTKERILRAAFDEFVEHGIAGARIKRIAVAADVAPGLIYHFFENKQALFSAVGELAFEQQSDFARRRNTQGDASDPTRRILGMVQALVTDPRWVRYSQWEMLERDSLFPGGVLPNLEGRRKLVADRVNEIAQAQASGRIDPDLDPGILQLVVFGLAVLPHAFPVMAELSTGRSVEDAEFVEEYNAFLEKLIANLIR